MLFGQFPPMDWRELAYCALSLGALNCANSAIGTQTRLSRDTDLVSRATAIGGWKPGLGAVYQPAGLYQIGDPQARS